MAGIRSHGRLSPRQPHALHGAHQHTRGGRPCRRVQARFGCTAVGGHHEAARIPCSMLVDITQPGGLPTNEAARQHQRRRLPASDREVSDRVGSKHLPRDRSRRRFSDDDDATSRAHPVHAPTPVSPPPAVPEDRTAPEVTSTAARRPSALVSSGVALRRPANPCAEDTAWGPGGNDAVLG